MSVKNAFAFSPVARFDVVPYQRIKNGSSFKIGVVAFSKPGIQKVELSASGQGYSGGTKTVTQMSLNDQTNTWEYWTTFSASEFTGNGAVTITSRITDNNDNTRDLTLAMIVEGASAFTPVTAWVSPIGSNTTCVVNNESLPCQNIAGAISKIQTANGGNSNGAIIYLEEGTYSAASTSASTTNEWLTITKDDTANKDNVIINAGQLATGYLKYDDITLQSQGSGLYVADDSSTRLWTNNCRRIGSGYDLADSNPVHLSDENNHYSTNDYTYDVDFAYRRAALVRGAEIVKVGNDAFQNTSMVVNATFTDQGNSHGWHADAYQVFSLDENSPPANNRIIYNYKATDLHYQGIFARSDYGQATDNAFVNVLMEMREPAMENESGALSYASHSFYQTWDHLIMWNNTFIGGAGEMYGDYTNSSFVGNVFDAYISTETATGTPALPSAIAGNANGNEFLDNHFNQIYGETSACIPNSRYTEAGWPCPHWNSKRPDSGTPDLTYSDEYGVLDTDYQSEDFSYPVQGSALIGRFTARVPIDIYNRERGSVSDVGAVEYSSQTEPTYQCSDGSDNDSDSLTDYPNDPGCSSVSDNDEYNAPASQPIVSQDSNNSDNDSGGSSKKKSTVKKRTISVSKKNIFRGETLVERGKKFSKNSTVTLYFSKYGGGYYPPMKIKTNKAGGFALSYKIPANKPKGAYYWYAVDDKTGKKSKTIRFVVK